MDFIGTFIDNLTREGKSLNTTKSYASDLAAFKAWFEVANKERLGLPPIPYREIVPHDEGS